AAGTAGSSPAELVVAGSNLFFRADDGTSGNELWRSDGSSAVRVLDINPGPAGSHPSGLVALGSTVFFEACSGPLDTFGLVTDCELWRSNGIATTRVADIVAGGSSYARPFMTAGSTLFLFANHPFYGTEPWVLLEGC